MDGSDPVATAAAAATADVVIVNVATTSSEGSDRKNLTIGYAQDQLVFAIAAVQKNTIVVARCPGACLMPWKDSVPAILFQLMPGQEMGNAIASTIFGDNNPSGKLPVTFPGSMLETWLSLPGPIPGPINPEMYPGTDRGKGWPESDYNEGLLIGYRWYDAQKIAPQWPFGHGLSYTTFGYTGLSVTGDVSASDSTTIAFTLTNTGAVQGAEVAQLYIGYPASAGEPPQVLKAFQKVPLTPATSEVITFSLGAKDLHIWDTVSGGWSLVAGTYSIYIGSTSRDIRISGSFQVQ
jgi:beta-glucosidase